MPFKPTPLQDALIYEPNVFGDSRGFFMEVHNQASFDAAGIDAQFVQDNLSKSCYGVVRGLHFQDGEHAQAKLVFVLQGKVLDVIVDMRVGSPTYGQKFEVELSAENKKALFVPRGFAHGFSVLSEEVLFFYKCDNLYNKASEGGVKYDDPALSIDWQIPAQDIILSDKDAVLPSFADCQHQFKY